MPEISVLMGIYNESREHTVLAIDSILHQTLDDFEFIICDDGSENGFFQWLQEYCKKDCRIHLLRSETNKGLAAALNCCLRHASGTYIARMDGDDISGKDRLERQAAFLKEHKEYDFVGCNAELFNGNCIWGERRMEEIPQKKSFLSTSPFIHPSVMIRREVLERAGGYCESSSVLRAEDYELFMRLYAAGCLGYNLQENLLRYRESMQAYSRRKYQYRVKECFVRWQGFWRLGILYGNLRYVVKPLAVGLIPDKIMQRIRLKRYGGAS